MPIRAIAVASDTSDIVGTVELCCEPDGLSLSFVRASSYASDYAPTPPASGRRAVVPYENIREVWDDGETLRLSLDAPRVPYKSMVLAHFTRDHRQDHRALYRERVKAQLGVSAAAALLVACLLPIARGLGLAAAMPVAALGTFLAVAGGAALAQAAGRRVTLGNHESAAERRAFFFELRRRVPLGATVVDDAAAALGPTGARAASTRPGVPVIADEGRGRLAEVTPTLLAVAGSAVVALLALVAGSRLLSPERAVTDDPRDSAPGPSALAGLAREADPARAPPPRAEALDTCLCQTPASPAIPARVPRVTLLSSVQRAVRDPKHPSLTVEVAAINNGAATLREVQGSVVFSIAGRRPDDPPRVRAEKGIYYEGPLGPGAAIKWHVSGRGTAYHVSGPDESALDEGAMAPADAFARLLSAHTRSVRVHGAMMLARMRDERAVPAIQKLRDDARDEELPVLSRLSRAAAPVYACDIEVAAESSGASRVSACLMNTGDEPAGPLDAVLTLSSSSVPEDPAGGPSTGVLGTAPVMRAVTIPPKAGVRVHGAVPFVAGGKDLLSEILLEPSAR